MTATVSTMTALLLVTVSCASAEGPAPVSDVTDEGQGAVAEAGVFELAPGVLIEPPRTVYLARPEGGIESVDAETGEPSWRSAAAARPLLVRGGRLLAQRESGAGLALAVLDTVDGRSLLELDVPLPEGVVAPLDESLGVSFTLRPRVVDGAAVLEWEYLERDVLGVSPPEGRPFARRELGAVKVDLRSGSAAAVDRKELSPVAGILPPSVQGLIAAGELRMGPWRSGGLLAAAQQLYEPRERLVLRRWRTGGGEALPEIQLAEGRAVAVLPAADRRHLLVVRRTAEPRAAEPYLWSIHSLATGEPLEELRSERSAAPFCLLRGRLFYLEPPSAKRTQDGWLELPLRLRALDPDSGEELWQRPVRDPVFRGPVPPVS